MNKKNKKDQKDETQNFEDSLEKLENVIEELESGDLGLDEALSHFENGIKLVHFCKNKLSEAERKIEMLTKGKNEITKVNLPVKQDTGELENEDVQGELLWNFLQS